MKNSLKSKILTVLLCAISFSAVTETWTEVAMKSDIKFPFTEDNTPFSLIQAYKFKKLVEKWKTKEYQEQKIAEFEKYGIDKALARRALDERLRNANKVIENSFTGDHNISTILDNLENRVETMKQVAVLGHNRFKKLANKYGIEIDAGFYQCLCTAQGITGSSLKYSPAPNKHCDTADPCKGGNWGCVHKDLPKKGETWISCAKQYPLKNGGNIFQVFDKHVNTSKKFNQDELARNLFDRTLKFKKSCLPSMDSKNIQDIQSLFKINVTKRAIDISESSENMCEEAIAVSLYLNSEKATSNAKAALEGLLIWALPTNSADISDMSIKVLPIKNQLTKLAGKYLPVLSNLMNINSTIDLMTRVYNEKKISDHYKEAFKLFEDSKEMDKESLDSYEQILKNKIAILKGEIDSSDDRYISQLEYSTALLEQKVETYQHEQGFDANPLEIRKMLVKFEKSQKEIKKRYEEEKSERLLQFNELNLYKNIITNYRKPLQEKGCKEFIEARKKQCREEFIKKSRGFKLEQG